MANKKEIDTPIVDESLKAIQGELEKILQLQTLMDIAKYAEALETRKQNADLLNQKIEDAKGNFGIRRLFSKKAQKQYDDLLQEKAEGFEEAQIEMIRQRLNEREKEILANEQKKPKQILVKRKVRKKLSDEAVRTKPVKAQPSVIESTGRQVRWPQAPTPSTTTKKKKPSPAANIPIGQVKLEGKTPILLSNLYAIDEPVKKFLTSMEPQKFEELFASIQRWCPDATKIQIEVYNPVEGSTVRPSFPKVESKVQGKEGEEHIVSVVIGTRPRDAEGVAIVCNMPRQKAIELGIVKDANLEKTEASPKKTKKRWGR